MTESPPRALPAALWLAVVLVVTYWTLWYTDRSLVASNHRSAYVEFENAFPLADGWLVLTALLALYALHRRSPAAPFWLAAGGSAAMYLFGMDVLYDLEHGIWWRSGAGGWIELAVNVLTLALGTFALVSAWWSWSHGGGVRPTIDG